MINVDEFRTYDIKIYNGGVEVEHFIGKYYIFYPKTGKDNYDLVLTDIENRRITIYGGTIIIKEL